MQIFTNFTKYFPMKKNYADIRPIIRIKNQITINKKCIGSLIHSFVHWGIKLSMN